MAKLFYSVEETAQKLGKSTDQVKDMAKSGELEEFREGDQLVFKAEQVDLLASDDELNLDLDDGLTISDESGGSSLGLADSEIDLGESALDLSTDDEGSESGIAIDDLGSDDLQTNDLGSNELDTDPRSGSAPVDPAGESAFDLSGQSGAGQSGAGLSGAGQSGAGLSGAGLSGAGQSGSNLSGVGDDLDGSAFSLEDDLDLDDDAFQSKGPGSSGSSPAARSGSVGLGDSTPGLADDLDDEPQDQQDQDQQDQDESAADQTGISIFGDDGDEADPSAETFVAGGAGIDLSADQLDAVGSGSGLLDLTREGDDTSLGVDLLEDAYGGGDAPADTAIGAAPDEGGTLFESTEATPDHDVGPAGAVMATAAEPYDGGGSGLVLGLALGTVLAVAFAGTLVILGQVGIGAGTIFESLGGVWWYSVAGIGAITLIAAILGWFLMRRG